MPLHSQTRPPRSSSYFTRLRFSVGFGLLVLTLVSTGCRRPPQDIEGEEGEVKFVLGDMVEPFEAPSLEELEAEVAASGGWEAGDVLLSMELLRERQKGETPSASIDEALAKARVAPLQLNRALALEKVASIVQL